MFTLFSVGACDHVLFACCGAISPQTAVGGPTSFSLSSRVLSGEDVKYRYHRQLMSRRESRVVCENTSLCHVKSFALLPPPDSYFLFPTTCVGFSVMTTLRGGFFFSPCFCRHSLERCSCTCPPVSTLHLLSDET